MASITDLLTTALQYHRSGQLTAAADLYQQVLQQQPQQPNALYFLGLLCHQGGDLAGAIAHYRQAIAVQPNYAEAHNNLGAALQQQGDLGTALTHYQAVLRIQPGNPHANINLGVVLQQQGDVAAAIARYQKAIRLNPSLPEAHTNLAHAWKASGDLDAAIASYRAALALAPTNPETHRDLGDALQESGQIEAAITVLDQAIEQFPQNVKLRGSRIRAKLISGALSAGFAEYDPWRLSMGGSGRTFSQPDWNGSSLVDKTILLYQEAGAGMGDLMQCVRYVPLLAEKGARVIVECHPPLQRLFQTVAGMDMVVATGALLPDFDVQASLLSMPYCFQTSLATVPVNVPYLQPPEITVDLLLPVPQSTRATLKIGIAWGGNPQHLHDAERSCPLALYRRFLDIPGVTVYSLQKGSHQAELSTIADLPVIDLSDRLVDFAATAALISQLDLVITVDTALAHLAGAMGKPVWILLTFAADWRWLLNRDDSPWYPTARLFRQPQRQDWGTVCDRISKELKTLTL